MNHISGRYMHTGLLVLRIGLGILYLFHGLPKLFGGPEVWEQYGEAIQHLGITTSPIFFGFFATMAETFGGILLIFGLYMKPALILLIITMSVATVHLISEGNPYSIYSHPLKMIVVFTALLITGPGKYSMDTRLKRRMRR